MTSERRTARDLPEHFDELVAQAELGGPGQEPYAMDWSPLGGPTIEGTGLPLWTWPYDRELQELIEALAA